MHGPPDLGWVLVDFETGPHYVAQAGLTLWHSSCLAPQVLGLQVCATLPSFYFYSYGIVYPVHQFCMAFTVARPSLMA